MRKEELTGPFSKRWCENWWDLDGASEFCKKKYRESESKIDSVRSSKEPGLALRRGFPKARKEGYILAGMNKKEQGV